MGDKNLAMIFRGGGIVLTIILKEKTKKKL